MSKLNIFVGQKSIVRHYCIQNVKDGIQIQAYNINNECVTHFGQLISEKVKKNLRKSQAQFWEKLRKLRFRPQAKLWFSYKKRTCTCFSVRSLSIKTEY